MTGDDIKPCPRCQVLIVKMDDGSCNHMTCAVCGAEFCWLCMKEISDLHYLRKLHLKDVEFLWQLTAIILYWNEHAESSPENYLTYRTSINKIRSVSQLRISNPEYTKISAKNKTFIFKAQDICTFCNHFIQNSLYHILLHCEKLTEDRKKYLQAFLSATSDDHKVQDILKIDGIEKLNKIHYFIMSACSTLESSSSDDANTS